MVEEVCWEFGKFLWFERFLRLSYYLEGWWWKRLRKLRRSFEVNLLMSFPPSRERQWFFRTTKMIYQKFYVYILASKKNGTLYVGITNDLVKRIYQHKEKMSEGFTKKYNVGNFVYYEIHDSIEEAILREKRIKKWNRKWKLRLVEESNPDWKDLYGEIIR